MEAITKAAQAVAPILGPIGSIFSIASAASGLLKKTPKAEPPPTLAPAPVETQATPANPLSAPIETPTKMPTADDTAVLLAKKRALASSLQRGSVQSTYSPGSTFSGVGSSNKLGAS